MRISDFRSDTVTKPTEEMRQAMAEAVVGDDVLGDDPTVQRLESMAADKLGKEAALFVPTGTMGNSIAVKAWTRELDEVIVEARSHIYNMESTHMTFISRVNPRIVCSRRGAMDLEEIEKAIRKPSVHHPRTSLICVENTHNNWGGAVVPLRHLMEIRKIADQHGLKVHMDGARIFNAGVASGTPVADFALTADSVMFCLSKGLSAPVGSVLTGPKDFIAYGRRLRKALGGGMRQVGVLAAPGIVALEKMVDRLAEDHRRAKKLAGGIADLPGIQLLSENVETDIVIFGLEHPRLSVPEFLSCLESSGILALPVSQGIRMVTNKEIDDLDVDRAISAFRDILLP
ncbi:MAG: GntG family PLP-dependent aldolase [Candidatus Aminicenantes bacterium]